MQKARIGSTFGVLLGMPLTTAILLAAVVTTAYTMLGGMWSVAYTDIFQLAIVAIGLCVALPFVLEGAGGIHHAWATYIAARPEGGGIVPPWQAHTELWNTASAISWWDTSVMLMCGGIPWNCYFQRVLSCRSPRAARGQSIALGRADDCVHGAAAADGHIGVRLSVAAGHESRACTRHPPTRCRCCSCTRCRASSVCSGSPRSSARSVRASARRSCPPDRC